MLQVLSFILEQNVFYKKNGWAARKIVDKSSMKKEKERFMSPSLLSKFQVQS